MGAAKKSVDYIQRYIFPGGALPSLEIIGHHLRKDTNMQMVALTDITKDYAKTLAEWRKRFGRISIKYASRGSTMCSSACGIIIWSIVRAVSRSALSALCNYYLLNPMHEIPRVIN